MPILYFVRHGRVAADRVATEDPELSPAGREQALAVAEELTKRLPLPLPIVTSPLRRCRETAAPLCAMWDTEPLVEARVAEVPGPPVSALPRDQWLQRALVAEWPELIRFGQTLQRGYDTQLVSWRAGVLEAALGYEQDTVVFSHFVPVNVLTGHATRSERVACFEPDHTSVTIFETSSREIRLLERGRERKSRPA